MCTVRNAFDVWKVHTDERPHISRTHKNKRALDASIGSPTVRMAIKMYQFSSIKVLY